MAFFICFSFVFQKGGGVEIFFLLPSAPHVGDITSRRIKSSFLKFFSSFFINFVTYEVFFPNDTSRRFSELLPCHACKEEWITKFP